MGRIYAGILGPLAFLTVVARGMLNGANAQRLLFDAWLFLWIFAAVGYVVGRLAAWVVEDSVRSRLSAELAAQEAPPADAKGPTR